MTAADNSPQHPALWRGDALLAQPDFAAAWSAAQLAALDAGTAPDARLRQVRDDLEHGCGAVRLRGWNIDDHDEAHLAHVFERCARAVGTPLSQTATGDRLLHVRDEGFAPDDPRFRGPHSNRPLRFHTDRCDVIAFLCVRDAKEGGENEVLSSMALRDELAARAPDALRELQGEFPYLRHTVDPDNPRPLTKVAVFTEHDGHFAASLLRVLIDRADAHPDAPDLTDTQRGALDTLEAVAEDRGLAARFRLEPGDMLFLNSWVTFHRRTAFVDHDDPARRRHLMRIWLSVPNSRPLDPRFEDHFGATAAGALRGGIWPKSPHDSP